MSTDERLEENALPEGFPELTWLGKRLEILRIERGISKQRLARHAGTSRQQLWRVMTGKSELTSSLRERLASALSVEPGILTSSSPHASTQSFALSGGPQLAATLATTGEPPSIQRYLAEPAHLITTLHTLPSGDAGRRLKRALLNAIEDLAMESGLTLPVDSSDIRRRVLAGEL
ncbi:MAG: helix-turn-helix transcriptional regulator [Thermoanaerobaculia bacterium]